MAEITKAEILEELEGSPWLFVPRGEDMWSLPRCLSPLKGSDYEGHRDQHEIIVSFARPEAILYLCSVCDHPMWIRAWEHRQAKERYCSQFCQHQSMKFHDGKAPVSYMRVYKVTSGV